MEELQEIQVMRPDMEDESQILLFYVDENGGSEQNVMTTVVDGMDGIEAIEGIEGMQVSMPSVMHDGEEMDTEQTYYIEDSTGGDDEPDEDLLTQYNPEEDPPWDESEIKRLLIFYTDNKETFNNGITKKRVLWSVACRTMLIGRTPATCEMQLVNLKREYMLILINHNNGATITWPFIEMAHRAFHDDPQVQVELAETSLEVQEICEEEALETKPVVENITETVQVDIEPDPKPENTFPCTQKKYSVPADSKVVQMLQLYIKHSQRLKKFPKNLNHKVLWETIVLEMREKDTEYWHHRFLNFKQHYIRILDKKMEGVDKTDVTWPYMEYFNQIFLDDPDFRKKYIDPNKSKHLLEVKPSIESLKHIWNDTEMTVLVKYYFDCYSEFQDKTIPNNFLWNEVGRLLDKNAADCLTKYTQLRRDHLKTIISGQYDFKKRIPVQILLDNIISRDVENEFDNQMVSKFNKWENELLTELVKIIHDNIVLFKDELGYYVVWAALGFKFNTTATNCLNQWKELRSIYKSYLDDKKNNPDSVIDWSFIDTFERIFDYGMDTKLLTGYENLKPKKNEEITANGKESETTQSNKSKDNNLQEKGYKARSKYQDGDVKAFKILEYYQKHKDKFVTNPRRKQALWDELAVKIGLSAHQCAHRFRNLKQVFTGYVEKELTRPDLPIVWPYYQLCKKVFGYRAVKTKLKNKLAESDEEDWSTKEIKQLIVYFSNNFNEINTDDSRSKWTELAKQIGKSETSCRDKFLELRKSYRKLKTKITRNPMVNITWKYYGMMDEIYTSADGKGNIGVMMMAGDEVDDDDKVADDEYQCIIVMPEGEETKSNTEKPETTEVTQDNKPKITKWNKNTKKRLLTLYLKYVKARKGEEISSIQMWRHIAEKLPNKTALSCRKMFAKLKTDRLNTTNEELYKNTPYYALLEEIITLKPKFKKLKNKSLEKKEYKDVQMPKETVQQALEYYLKNVEEFANPRFEKKYAWNDLAKAVNQPLNKIFNKINYLKNNINDQSLVEYADLLKQIVEKEESIKNVEGEIKKDDQNEEVAWSENETEQLLVWYLANLEKFKNPKFVRRYLWLEASSILNKSALSCSKQMSEIRTEYRTLVKEKPEELPSWRFNVLCQKIYGTGKQKT